MEICQLLIGQFLFLQILMGTYSDRVDILKYFVQFDITILDVYQILL